MALAGFFWLGEEFGHGHPQGTGNTFDIADGNIALAAFDRTYVVGMQSRAFRQDLLGKVPFQAQAPHIAGKQQLGTELLGWIPHVDSVDDGNVRIHTLWV